MVDTRFFNSNAPMSLEEIAKVSEAELVDKNKGSLKINGLSNMKNAGEGEICFFYDRKMKAKAAEIKATACVTTEELLPLIPEGVVALVASNPHLAFLKLNRAMYSEPRPAPEIRPTAVIDKSAVIGENCLLATML